MTSLHHYQTGELRKYLFPGSVPEAIMKKIAVKELMARCQQGDQEACEILKERESEVVCREYANKMKAKEVEHF